MCYQDWAQITLRHEINSNSYSNQSERLSENTQTAKICRFRHNIDGVQWEFLRPPPTPKMFTLILTFKVVLNKEFKTRQKL